VNLRVVAERLSWAIVLGCFAAYGLTVATNAALRLSSIWGWPFWWLWIVAGIAGAAFLSWAYLLATSSSRAWKTEGDAVAISRHPVTGPILNIAATVPRQGAIAAAKEALAKERTQGGGSANAMLAQYDAAIQAINEQTNNLPKSKVIVDYTVLSTMWGPDYYGELRSDKRWWVFRNDSQKRKLDVLGYLIQDPSDNTWEVRSSYDAHVGWYSNQSDAARGLLESWTPF
jgi:hypothetical protein